MRTHKINLFVILILVLWAMPGRSATAAVGKELVIQLEVPASVPEVWKAFTTTDGLTSWLAPQAKVELRPGGDWIVSFPGGRSTGGGTIVSYVPEKEIVLSALAPDQFPHVRAERTRAVFSFEARGDSTVVRLTQTGWKTGAELQKAADDAGGGIGPEFIVLLRINNFTTPAAQAKMLLEKGSNVKKAADVYTADLSEAAAKDLMSFRRPGAAAAAGAPQITVKDAKGTLKLTVKDGVLSKMEIHLTGTRTFNDQDMPVDQTTTLTIKDVGSTKLTVPDEAKKKLAEAATAPATTTAPAK